MDMFGCHLSKDQCEALAEYDYPGNVRELINILDRARALEEDDFRKLIKEHQEINRELWSAQRACSTKRARISNEVGRLRARGNASATWSSCSGTTG